MPEYTSYGFEFVPGCGDAAGEVFIVLPQGHKGVIDLSEEDLRYMLSVIESQKVVDCA